MMNFYNQSARSLVGVVGAVVLSLGLLTVTVAPALTASPQVAAARA